MPDLPQPIPREADNADDFTAAVLKYLDGELTPREVDAFADAMSGDRALVERFVSICYLEQLSTEISAVALVDLEAEALDSGEAMLPAQLVHEVLNRQRETRLIEEASRVEEERSASRARERARRRDDASSDRDTKPRQIVVPRWGLYGGIAAALAFAVLLLVNGQPGTSPPPRAVVLPPEVGPEPVVVAQLIRAHRATWSEDAPAADQIDADTRVPGQIYVGQRLRLEEGLVELQTARGVRVLLQGPAEAMFESEMALRLRSGRLSATVAVNGRGFEVRTDQATIVDRGTEFGVSVDRSGQTRADVFAGLITYAPPDSPHDANPLRLVQGEGIEVGSTGEARRIEADELAYVREPEFEARVLADAGSAYHRWLAYCYALRRDPSVVAFYLFEQADHESNTLHNSASGPQVAPDGQMGNGREIAAPTWERGRFEKTHALQFGLDGAGRVRGVVVPDHDSLDLIGPITFAAWVKPRGISDPWNTIFSKRDIPPNRLNYQLSVRGLGQQGKLRFQFGMGDEAAQVAWFDHTPELSAPAADSWQHVAVTVDGKSIRYYHNGVRVLSRAQSETPVANDAPLLIGTSSPMLEPPYQHGMRPLDGAISELMIASRIFNEHEIRTLYDAGRPE